jgi:hypothetical protein
MWQYVLLNWPAWKASLQEDAEVVLEYALGYIPAWLAVLYASAMRACHDLAASAPVQQLVTATAAAVAAAEASAVAVTEAAQRSMQQTAQLVQKLLPPGCAPACLSAAGLRQCWLSLRRLHADANMHSAQHGRVAHTWLLMSMIA